jgi:K+-dependent Na+/Ca+ exchanger-like protein
MNILLSVVVIAGCFYIMSKVVDEYFIPSLDVISKWLKLPQSVAGATLMAMGTSAPEVGTATFAFFLPQGNPSIGFGTVVGSAIFNILVVIGFTAMIKTSYLNWRPVIRDGVFYFFSIGLLAWFVADGVMTLIESGILLFSYLIYLVALWLWVRYSDEVIEPDPIELVDEGVEEISHSKSLKDHVIGIFTYPVYRMLAILPDVEEKPRWTIPVFTLSLVIIGLLSYVLVVSAESLATGLGIPPVIIALTVLAGGSSIPEMIGSAIVTKQGRGDMAISNAMGSNIFGVQVSLGLPVFLYVLSHGTLYDLGGANISSSIMLLFFTLMAVLVLMTVKKFMISRMLGLILIGMYGFYVVAAYAGWV